MDLAYEYQTACSILSGDFNFKSLKWPPTDRDTKDKLDTEMVQKLLVTVNLQYQLSTKI